MCTIPMWLVAGVRTHGKIMHGKLVQGANLHIERSFRAGDFLIPGCGLPEQP
jgi:hypothetical protein